MKQPRESRYLLSDYITREKKKISANGVEYEVTLYQGDHSNEYLLSEMKDGKVEGRCLLFNRGILSLSWMMKNGKRIGEITEYENGKALRKEKWNSILGNGGRDRRMIENSKEGLIMTIRGTCKNGEDNHVIYRGEFDEEMNRDGFGMEYDAENGKEKIEGYWFEDKLIRITREFDAENNQMIEYALIDDEMDNMDLLSRIPIYIGGYGIENGKYVRHGIGYLIDEESGTAIRESEWENGKEKKESGIDLHEGWYVVKMEDNFESASSSEDPIDVSDEDFNNGQNEDSIEIYNEDFSEGKNENSVIISNEDNQVNVPTKRIEVYNRSELNKLDLNVTDLLICPNYSGGLNEFNLNQFEWLQSLGICGECFCSVQTFKIDGLNHLKTIKIGKNSFTQSMYSLISDNRSESFHILNCESLESIQIGERSFSDFAGEFELKNLPKLQSIQIGTIGSNSGNFFFSSFVIQSIELILNI